MDGPAESPNPRPRVMHVITDLDTGGAETMLANLVVAQKDLPEPPLVVSLTPGGTQAARITAAALSVRHLGMRRGWPNPMALFRLVMLIRSFKPKVIQSWMYHADLMALLALLLSGRRRSTRLLWGVRCSDMDLSRYALGLRIVIRLCAWLSSVPNAVVANSHAGRTFHRSLGYKARRFLVAVNGVDMNIFRPDSKARAEVRAELGIGDDEFLVGTSARVDPMKDYPTFMAALGHMQRVYGLAAGRGTGSLPDQIRFFGLGERPDMPRVLNALDLFVSASAFGEGFSNALVEAMATGLPVIATGVGDAALIIDDSGVVVPPRDVSALAAAIDDLKNDPARCKNLGRAARARVAANYDLKRIVRDIETLHGDW